MVGRTGRRVWGPLGTLVLAVLVVATALGGIGVAQSSPSVVISDVQVDAGGSADVTLALTEAPEGVAGFDLTVTLVDGSVATIAGVQVHESYGMQNVSIYDGGSKAYASGVDIDRVHEAGDQDVPLVTVTVEGLEDGETPLDVLEINLDDDNGNDVAPTIDYGVVTVGNGSTQDSTTNESTATTATESSSGGGGGQTGSDGPSYSTNLYDTDAGATVWFTDITQAPELSANVSGASGQGVAVEGLTVDLKFSNSRFRAEVTDPTASPQGAPALEGATTYFRVDTYNLDWDSVNQVRLTVELNESAIPEGGVQLYHYADGEWHGLNTTRTGDGQFTATAQSFSPFAVGSADSTTTETTEATATPTDGTDGTATENSTADGDTTTEQSATPPSEQSGASLVVVVLASLLALLAGGLVVSRRE